MKTKARTIKSFFLLFSALSSVFLFYFAGVPFCIAGSVDFENSPVLEAGKILPSDVLLGPNHELDAQVQNDGFLNHYALKSRYENYEVVSTFELKKRVHEINAITEMKKIDTSGTVGESIVDSGEKTVIGIKNLFLHPLETTEGTVTGSALK